MKILSAKELDERTMVLKIDHDIIDRKVSIKIGHIDITDTIGNVIKFLGEGWLRCAQTKPDTAINR